MAKYVKVNILMGRPHGRNLFALGNRTTGNIGKWMQMIHCCCAVAVLRPSPTQELGGSASSRRDDSTGRRSAKGSAPGSVSGLANYSHWVSLIPRGITRVIICGVCRKDYRLKFAVQNPSLQFNLWNWTKLFSIFFDFDLGFQFHFLKALHATAMML